MLKHLPHNISHLIKLSFNTPKSTMGLDALSPSSAAHPQMKGQVERANRLIMQGMKTEMFHDLKARGRN
jgi:hypothetical protein